MFSYNLFNAVLDFVGLASTVTVVVWLVFSVQRLFKRLRESSRARQSRDGRALLLWYALLIPMAWIAAAALYFRELSLLWDFMGTWLEEEHFNRPLYALLHLYLFFLLVCGNYACAVTGFEIFQNRKVLSDLFMIAKFNPKRYQAIEDLEAQHGSSSADPVEQDEDSHWNAQERNEDVAPAEAGISEPECPTEKAAWPRYGGCNNSEVAGPSNQDHPTLDSDGNAIIMTPSSPYSSNASSGIDECEYVDDDDDRYRREGVRPRKSLEDPKQKNTNASYTLHHRECVEEDDRDHISNNLYYATPRLSPEDQNVRSNVKPLDIGEPPSPCESCSSARAKLIPTAKRSPVRVPITPTSPTADADDADSEKTDVERKQRDRKTRNTAPSAQQSPWAKALRIVPPCDTTTTILPGTDPTLGANKANTKPIESNLAAPALKERERSTALGNDGGGIRHLDSELRAYMSRQQEKPAVVPRIYHDPRPKPSAPSAPAVSAPPLDPCKGDSALYWRAYAVDNSARAAAAISRDKKANPVPFVGRSMFDPATGIWTYVGP